MIVNFFSYNYSGLKCTKLQMCICNVTEKSVNFRLLQNSFVIQMHSQFCHSRITAVFNFVRSQST